MVHQVCMLFTLGLVTFGLFGEEASSASCPCEPHEAIFPLTDIHLTGGLLGAQQEQTHQYLCASNQTGC